MLINANLIESDIGNKITIELSPYDILHDLMSCEQRQLLIESLSCHDEIINHVVEQLIDNYTYNGFAGSWCTSRTGAIQIAKARIAKEAVDNCCRKTIQDMEMQIKSLQESVDYYVNNWTPRRDY